MQDLGRFAGADDSWAIDINSRGETVGYVISPTSSNDDHYHAVVWTHGKARYLRPLPNCRYSMATGINDAGVVVGNSTSAQMDRHNEEIAYACRWDKGGVKTLPALGGDYSDACSINEAGQIAGKADTQNGRNTRAVLWNRERATDLGPPQRSNSQALRVNVRGDVVGFVVTRSGSEGFLWRAGRLLDLGNLIDQDKGEVDPHAWRESVAMDVNARGDVVGYANPPGSDHEVVAVIWRGGRIQDLNSFIPASEGWVLDGAHSINDKGEIVGSGKHNGAEHAFLLRPIPKS